MNTRHLTILLGLAGFALVAAPDLVADTKGKPARRALPPKFDKPGDIFYRDAFQEALVGERPADLGKAVAKAASPGAAPAAPESTGGLAGSGWSAIISAATIEDEIKSLKNVLDQDVTTPSDYAGKGYKVARRDFSLLAMLFGIAGEYDADVRWKKESPTARDVFARTAANSKVGTSQVYAEAKLRKQELQDLVGGSNPFKAKDEEAKAAWNTVCDRTPLMQHLDLVFEPKVKQWTADKGQFTANRDKLAHEVEIIAAVATVLAKPGMEDADADEYKAFCAKLQKGARDIADACKTKNFDAASAGVGLINKSCTECHEQYRSGN